MQKNSLPRWRTLTEEQKLSEVKAAIEDRGNYTTMSEQFGVSRGAIAKFCMNNGLKTIDAQRRQKGSVQFVTPKMRAAREKARGKPNYFTSPKRFNDRGYKPAPESVVKPPQPVDGQPVQVEGMLCVHFLDRQTGQCAYPLWGLERNPPVSAQLVCGLPVHDDSPYCSGHHSRCYYPASRRDEDK